MLERRERISFSIFSFTYKLGPDLQTCSGQNVIYTLPAQGGFVTGLVAAVFATPDSGVQADYFTFDKLPKV